MEKEKHILKGMREFVLMQNMHFANEEINLHQLQLLILKFAEFIGQKLEIWMFVPAKFVDGVWVVLEEPIYNTDHSDDCYCKGCEKETQRCDIAQKEYQEAKERVLFEGCKTENNPEFPNFIPIYINGLYFKSWDIDKSRFHDSDNWNIERLVPKKIILTESTANKLGLT